MTEEKIIFPEDVQLKTITITKFDDGTNLKEPITLYLADDHLVSNERTARDILCTHYSCECGCPSRKPFLTCEDCRDKARKEKYNASEKKEWLEDRPVCNGECYFNEWWEIFNFCLEEDCTLDDLELIHTEEKKYKGCLDFFNLFHNVIPEGLDYDEQIPSQIKQAIDEFNKKIDNLDITASYVQTKVYVLITDEIREEFKKYKQEQENE